MAINRAPTSTMATVASLAVDTHHLLGPLPYPQQVNGRDPAPPSSRPALPRWPATSSSADAWARSCAAVCWGRPRLAGAGRTRGCAAAGRRRVGAGAVPRRAAVAQPVEVAAPVAAVMQAREEESARQWRLDGYFFLFFWPGVDGGLGSKQEARGGHPAQGGRIEWLVVVHCG